MSLANFAAAIFGGAPDSVPYVAEYRLAPGAAAPSATLGAVEGLEAWYVVEEIAGQPWLVTYWKSQAHFARGNGTVEVITGTTAALRGQVGQLGAPEKPWWKRIKPVTVVLSTAALLGAVEVITNRYDGLFAAPSILVELPAAAIAKVEGEEFSVSASVSNQTGTAHSEVDVKAELVGPAGSVPLKVHPAHVPRLAASAAKISMVSGVAPESGEYVLRVTAAADAGWLRDRGSATDERPLVVWPKAPRAELAFRPAGQNAMFDARIRMGTVTKEGVLCEVVFTDAGGLRYLEVFDANVPRGDAHWTDPPDGASGGAGIMSFTLRPAEGKQRIIASFGLAGSAGVDWTAVAGRANIECQNLN